MKNKLKTKQFTSNSYRWKFLLNLTFVALLLVPMVKLTAAKTATHIVIASQAGAHLDSDVSTGGGTDDTRLIQEILDRAPKLNSLKLVVDGAILVSGLRVHSNTTIECLGSDCGFFLADNSDQPIIRNADPSATERKNCNITFLGGTYNGNSANQTHNTLTTNATAIQLPAWVSDYMLLPAGKKFKIEGTSAPKTKVTVSFANFTTATMSDEKGSWVIDFPALERDKKGELVFVSDTRKIVIKDVVCADTWLCSGQSNMAMTVAKADNPEIAAAAVDALDIRVFTGKVWRKVTSKISKDISAVALYFAIEMATKQQSAIGIYVAARGGTGIEAWIPQNAFPDTETGRRMGLLVNDPEVLKAAAEDAIDFRPPGEYRLARWGLGRAVPASLYDQLIKPYLDFPLRGVIWYQGESNTASVEQAVEYKLWLKSLISVCRSQWHEPKLPFIVVRLPQFNCSNPEAWSVLQNVQTQVANEVPNTALVNIDDLGDLNDIHPRKKREVGIRAAEVMLKLIRK